MEKQTKLPLVSVITVSYSAKATIESTILSVINQTYPYIEYIIIDGGSTDGTVDIIKKYAHKISYWVSEPDKGIYDAMNKGMKIAKGDWVIFIGSDDVFYNDDVILKVASRMISSDRIYYGNVILKTSQRLYPFRIKSKYQLCLTNFCHQAIFYPRVVYKYRFYDTDYKLWADYVYNLNLYSIDSSKFEYLNIIVSIFNNQGRGSQSKDLLFIQNRLSLIEKLWGKKMKYIMKFRYLLSKLFHGF